jgi:predicted ester cyclase
MSAEKNIEVTRQVIEEAFNKGNYDVLKSCFRPDYIEHQFGLRKDLEGMQSDIAYLRRVFPDFHLTIEHLAVDGDKVWLYMTARGTNLGGHMGPPNEKSFEVAVFDLLRFEDGLIVEHWGSPDRFAQMSQLGLLPSRKQEIPA